MANATAKVNKGARRITDEFRKRSSVTLATALQFYTGGMLGRTSAGYLAKFDDTQAMVFVGLVRGDNGDPKVPISTAGDGTGDIDYQVPPGFELAISGVAVTDIGRRVYALDDHTGTLDPSTTTYANLIGVVADVTATSGIAIVDPIYQQANGGNLQVMGASGAVTIKPGAVVITKAGVAALTLADPTAGVHDGLEMTFISATAQAHTLSNAAGSGFNAGGAGSDVGTFSGSIGDGITIVAYAGKWLVKFKTNVTLA